MFAFGIHDPLNSSQTIVCTGGPTLPSNKIGITMELKKIANKTILQVPFAVRTEGELLLYDTTATMEKEATPLIFHQFLRLNPNDPKQIADFARRWGALGLCHQHQLPTGHPIPSGTPGNCWPAKVTRGGAVWLAEPLSKWREIALMSASLLRVARDIEQLKPGEKADWKIIQGNLDSPDPVGRKRVRRNLDTSRSKLAEVVQAWLGIGRISPRFAWDFEDENWVLRHDVPGGAWGLFGWLALRLAIEIRGGRFAVCSNCGREHHVDRLPSDGKPNYCKSEECRRALWRNNKRKHAAG
jgi:hypothetical protein